MKRFRLIPLFLIVPVALVGGIITQRSLAEPQRIVDLRTSLTFEYARTAAEQERGLGGRPSLAPNAAMLFVFERPAIQTFWMKGMRFPIDIIWIRGTVVEDVATLEPPQPDDLAPAWHRPRVIADRVLEVNAGTAKRFGIMRGVKLLLPE